MPGSTARYATAEVRADINMTPLIDVMLALFVIFLISAPLVLRHFSLPLASSTAPAQPSEPVTLHVGADGALAWNGAIIPAAMLGEELRLLALRNPQPELRIEVDRSAPYERFAAVLADAKIARVEKIGVVAER